ncbi:MAG TPA: hypothetical protein VFF06_10165 [Polyangia bacterium]|nr:hypothetical protein [Polyangia bacterium]
MLEVSIQRDPRLVAARDSLDEAARLGAVPSWLQDAFVSCCEEIARLMRADCVDPEHEPALARAETLIAICKERTPSSSWPAIELRR